MIDRKRNDRTDTIRENILLNYPGAVLYGFFFNISLMIDSIIAGQSLGAGGIAAVALGVPGYGVPAAIIYSLIHGSGLRMIWAKGRADSRGFRRAFNGGTTLIGLLGLVFAVLILRFADSLVLLCGGDIVDDVIRHDAVTYLMFCAPIVFLTALGMVLQEFMNVYGYQNSRAVLGIINVGVNLIVSVTSVALLPENMKLAGLGLGTSAGGLAEFAGGIIILKLKGIRIGYRPLLLSLKEIGETVRCGFPAAADYFAENVLMGIQNNLVLGGFPGDPLILPTVEVVCNISYFASGMIKGAAIVSEPLFGVFYVERDPGSIKKVWKESWVTGIVMSVVWSVIFYAFLPGISALCGMELSPDIRRGVLLCLIFVPVMHTVYMLTLYYEATERFALSMAFAILPDSILYPVMMAALIPVMGKDGIWFPITGNQVVGLILLIPLVYMFGPKTRKGMERLLLMPEEFYEGKYTADFEIAATGSDTMAELQRLSEPLQRAAGDPERAKEVMLCTGFIVSEMRGSAKNIHIRLREEKDGAMLFIRSLGKPWKLPESAEESVKSWGENCSISHSYVYKMNIVCVNLSHIENLTMT